MIIKDIELLKQTNEEGKYRPQPLSDYEIKVLDNQLFAINSTMWNNPLCLRFDADKIDVMWLYEAASRALLLHPVMDTRIFVDANGEFKKQICPGFVRPNLNRGVSEADMQNILSQYPKVFELINSPLSMIDIYETEKHIYIIIDAHHIIVDGTSGAVFVSELARQYGPVACESEEDLFTGYSILEYNYRQTEEYNEEKNYYEEAYLNQDWCNMPTPDFAATDDKLGYCPMSLGVSLDDIKAAEKTCRTTRARLANAAGLLALAKHCQKDALMITWIYNNRMEKWKQNMIGLLIRELPIGINISEMTVLEDLYKAINKQMKESTRRLSYQYIVEHEAALSNDCMEVNYKGSSMGIENMVQYLGELGQSVVRIPLENEITDAEARLEIDVYENLSAPPEEQLYINPTYMASIFKDETIKGFLTTYCIMFQRLVKACRTTPISELLAD